MSDWEKYEKSLLYALQSVVWYNGLEDVGTWEHLPLNEYGTIWRPKDVSEQGEIIWMICVSMFGDYGTSPRSGWIEDIDGFRSFVHELMKIYREE